VIGYRNKVFPPKVMGLRDIHLYRRKRAGAERHICPLRVYVSPLACRLTCPYLM
jgi:hypothetical protein